MSNLLDDLRDALWYYQTFDRRKMRLSCDMFWSVDSLVAIRGEVCVALGVREEDLQSFFTKD